MQNKGYLLSYLLKFVEAFSKTPACVSFHRLYTRWHGVVATKQSWHEAECLKDLIWSVLLELYNTK